MMDKLEEAILTLAGFEEAQRITKACSPKAQKVRIDALIKLQEGQMDLLASGLTSHSYHFQIAQKVQMDVLDYMRNCIFRLNESSDSEKAFQALHEIQMRLLKATSHEQMVDLAKQQQSAFAKFASYFEQQDVQDAKDIVVTCMGYDFCISGREPLLVLRNGEVVTILACELQHGGDRLVNLKLTNGVKHADSN